MVRLAHDSRQRRKSPRSSWIALRRRIVLTPGQRVLVLGATGNAGQMAIQIAKRVGAGAVIGAGRNRERLEALPALGADAAVSLDYLWGKPAEEAMPALLTARSDRSRHAGDQCATRSAG